MFIMPRRHVACNKNNSHCFLMKSSTLKTVPYISERENVLCGIVFGTHRDTILFDSDIGHVE